MARSITTTGRSSWARPGSVQQRWVGEKIKDRPERSHGFRYLGQYKEQAGEMLQIAQEG